MDPPLIPQYCSVNYFQRIKLLPQPFQTKYRVENDNWDQQNSKCRKQRWKDRLFKTKCNQSERRVGYKNIRKNNPDHNLQWLNGRHEFGSNRILIIGFAKKYKNRNQKSRSQQRTKFHLLRSPIIPSHFGVHLMNAERWPSLPRIRQTGRNRRKSPVMESPARAGRMATAIFSYTRRKSSDHRHVGTETY